MKKHKPPALSETNPAAAIVTFQKSTPTLTATPLGMAMTLKGLRDKTMRERHATQQTIAELNALRDEIDATLAYLRAQK